MFILHFVMCIVLHLILLSLCLIFFFFFFKQKTAYEMRISDWSSDVCSSDLRQRLARKVALAVATAEYHLERPLRTVLDIGCGEGAWRAPLLKLRPGAQYLGFDSSEYAITRYGRHRNLHFARFADFAQLRPCAPVDLLVCSDVLHYLPAREIDRGLPGLAEPGGGVAFLATFAHAHQAEGAGHDYKPQPGAQYLGFDSSEYAITRYGRHRNLHFARFADFAQLRPCAPVDLLVCSDVLHYLPAREIDRGLPGLAELCGGVAFLETFGREDQAEGDEHEFKQRPAGFYRRRFEAAGLRMLGSHCWLSPALAGVSTALEVS